MKSGYWLLFLVIINHAVVIEARMKTHKPRRMASDNPLGAQTETVNKVLALRQAEIDKRIELIKQAQGAKQAELAKLMETVKQAQVAQREKIAQKIETVKKALLEKKAELDKQKELANQAAASSNSNGETSSKESYRAKLVAVSVTLFIVVFVMGLLEDFGPGGSGGTQWMKMVLMIMSAVSLIGSQAIKRNRRLKLRHALKNAKDKLRRLTGSKASSLLFDNIVKMLKKEDLKAVNIKKPNKIFGFVRKFIRTKLSVKSRLDDKILSRVWTVSGIDD